MKSYLCNNLPNPLPDDGYPRITTEGYEILREGLNGNFDRWAESIGNHPIEIAPNQCRCIIISCDPKKMHFQIRLWFGQKSPQINYQVISPQIEFDTIDTREIETDDNGNRIYAAPEGYFILRNSKDSYFTTGISILLDDYGTDVKRRTHYKTLSGYESVPDSWEDDEEDCEDCPVVSKGMEIPTAKVKTLESFL